MFLKTTLAFRLEQEERLVLIFRKHWFVFISEAIWSVLAVFLPPVILIALAAFGFDATATFPPLLVTFIHFWWLLIVWMAVIAIWTNYYLDMWIVTDKRLVSIDQINLFHREATTLLLANVQDVTIEQRGIIQTFLDFGMLTVQTAGPSTNNMIIVGVAHPGKVRDKIIAECEHYRHHIAKDNRAAANP